MAINYNEDGLYLGYFDTLEELLSKYNGLKGNFAVVGTSIVVYNGEEWITPNATVDTEQLRQQLAQESEYRRIAIEELEERIDKLGVTGIEIRWSYKGVIGESEDEPQDWFTSPLEATEDNQVVYMSSRIKTQESGWSYWSEPTVFVRYVPTPKDAVGYQTIFTLRQADTDSMELYQVLMETYLHEDYQNDEFVPEGWDANVLEPDAENRFVYVSMRKKNNGKWGYYSTPVIGYRYSVGSDGASGENAKVLVLTNERVAIACDSDGSPTGDNVAKTYIKFFDGSTEVTSGVTFDCVTEDLTPGISGNEVIAVVDKATPRYNVLYITARYKGRTYQIPWVIEKVIPAADGVSPKVYSLMLSETVGKLTADGTFENPIVRIVVQRNHEGVTKELTVAEMESDGLSLKVVADGTSATIDAVITDFLMIYGDAKIDWESPNSTFDCTFSEYMKLTLMSGDTELDAQTLRVVANGEDGLTPIIVEVVDTVTVACDAEGYVLDDVETGTCAHASPALSNSSFHIDVRLRQGTEDVTELLMHDLFDDGIHSTASFPTGKGIASVEYPTSAEPTSYHVSLFQPDKTASVTITLYIRYEWGGVVYTVSKPVRIIRNFAGKDGADGEVDYDKITEVITEQVASEVNNNETFAQMRAEIGELRNGLDEVVGDYVKKSELELTAAEISAEVSKKVSGEDLEAAGFNITSEGVTIYGNQVKIQQSKDSPSPTALFKDGYLNAELIKTEAQMFYDENGRLRSSINRYGQGEFVQYRELNANDSEQEPSKLIEYGLDTETESVIRMYDAEGNIVKMLGFDLTVKEYVAGATSTVRLAYVGTGTPTVVLEEYKCNTYYKSNETGIVYKNASMSEKIDDGWYTGPGLSMQSIDGLSYTRSFTRYSSGLMVEGKTVTSYKTPSDIITE